MNDNFLERITSAVRKDDFFERITSEIRIDEDFFEWIAAAIRTTRIFSERMIQSV